MSPKLRVRIVDVAVLAIVAYFAVPPLLHHRPESPGDDFARQVRIEPLRKIAIQAVGRIASFDSHARSIIRAIGGPAGVGGADATFAYLDLMLNRDAYLEQDTIYVKTPIRHALARVMAELDLPEARIAAFLKRGMISESLIRTPEMLAELARLDADVIRTAKFVQMIETAVGLSNPHELSARMTIVPPPGGTEKDRWLAGEDLWGTDFLHDGHDHGPAQAVIPGLDPQLRDTLASSWNALADAWRARNAEAASQAIATLAAALPQVEPSLYPPADKLSLESWYFRMRAFVWGWTIYILAAIPLLLSVIYRWRRALNIGVFILLIAFAIHTASLAIRWKLAGRIPNANMFEAVLAATWFGVAGSFFLEFWARKTAMRGLFFLGSGVCAMVAMMCQHFMPTELRSDIDNVMPVLDDVWLYIHTNVIIWSYALIGMAAISALLYLRYRLGGGNPAVAKAGGAGSLILQGASGKGDSFLRENPATFGQVLDAATMVTMELSFVMLWAGLVMGAIWADHSWGRPWGWDPKEVFALCTFFIFMILVHVRFKVRDKGFWTAVLAVFGCGVMLFNWIIINFKIQGLHSYA